MSTNAMNFDLSKTLNIMGVVFLEGPFKVFDNVTLNAFEGGAFSYIGPSARLHWVKLGRYCSIGNDVSILSEHPTDWLTTSPVAYQSIFQTEFKVKPPFQFDNLKTTIIGNDVWIGAGVQIKTGVRIGDGAIIGAGAVVSHDVDPYTICGGVPAKKIRDRFSINITKRLLALEWWNYHIFREDLPLNKISESLDVLEKLVEQDLLEIYRHPRFKIIKEAGIIKGIPDN